MNKKVIYVSYIALTDKVCRDWHIDFLIEKGVRIEFWDLTPLLQCEFDEVGKKTTDYLVRFETCNEVERRLRVSENKDAIYIMLINYDGFTTKVFRLLSKYHCKLIHFATGATPTVGSKKEIIEKLLHPKLLIKNIYNKFNAIANRKLGFVEPFYKVFVAGSVYKNLDMYADKVIPINSADYDCYKIESLELKSIVTGHYAVFLDVNLPSHSDVEREGGRSVSPKNYYASLNRFFDLLEGKYKVKIVIAAHPKSDYKDDFFNGREVYYGLTSHLVKDADFVVMHESTSLSYAILNYKPIICCYTSDMTVVFAGTYINYVYNTAEYLGVTIFNVDEVSSADQISISKVNEDFYDDYKYDYLTSLESEDCLTQDIFWNEINKK